MVTPIETDPSLSTGNPERIFEGQYGMAFSGQSVEFDLSPDGERCLMLKPAATSTDGANSAAELVVVFNWFNELQRLVPSP